MESLALKYRVRWAASSGCGWRDQELLSIIKRPVKTVAIRAGFGALIALSVGELMNLRHPTRWWLIAFIVAWTAYFALRVIRRRRTPLSGYGLILTVFAVNPKPPTAAIIEAAALLAAGWALSRGWYRQRAAREASIFFFAAGATMLSGQFAPHVAPAAAIIWGAWRILTGRIAVPFPALRASAKAKLALDAPRLPFGYRTHANRILKSSGNNGVQRKTVGFRAEMQTAVLLMELPKGWWALHDLPLPGSVRANIDHVLVGPTGVYVVDSKIWKGRVHLADSKAVHTTQGGSEPLTSTTEQLAWAVRAVTGHLQSVMGTTAPRVRGLVVVAGAKVTAGVSDLVRGTRIVYTTPTELIGLLQAANPSIEPGSEKIVLRALKPLCPAQRPVRSVGR